MNKSFSGSLTQQTITHSNVMTALFRACIRVFGCDNLNTLVLCDRLCDAQVLRMRMSALRARCSRFGVAVSVVVSAGARCDMCMQLYAKRKLSTLTTVLRSTRRCSG